MDKKIPLVIYGVDGRRDVVGDCSVNPDGTVVAVFRDPKVAQELLGIEGSVEFSFGLGFTIKED